MNDNLPSKNILIYDPFSSNGLELAKKLYTKGFHVVVFCDPETVIVSCSTFLKNSNIVIYPNTLEAVEEFITLNSTSSIERIIIMKNIIDSKSVFASDDFKEYLNKIIPITKLNKFGTLHGIKILEPHEWHCSLQVLDEVINKMDSLIRNSDIRKLVVNCLDYEFFIIDNTLYLDYLASIFDDVSLWPESNQKGYSRLPFRNLIRMYFEELGVEIEFCGKSILEKIVIVDYLEDNLALVSSPLSKIRLGNTILKIDENNYNKLNEIFVNNSSSNLSDYGDTKVINTVRQLILKRTQ